MRGMYAVLRTVTLGLAVLGAGLAHAQIRDVNQALNKMGRQAMVSQRLAKTSLQVNLGVDADRSKKALKQAQSLFEVTLQELTAWAPNADVKDTCTRLEVVWFAYQELLEQKPSPAAARRVLEQSDKMLSVALAGIQQVEKLAGKPQAKFIGVAGRLRATVQRVAKLHHAAAYQAAPDNVAQQLTTAREEFDKGLQELAANPKNSAQLTSKLESIKQFWKMLGDSLAVKGQIPKQESAIVAQLSDQILEQLEEITALYEEAAVSAP